MKKVHITLVGSETLPAYYPIKMLMPDEVHIIGSNQTKEQVKRIQSVLRSEGTISSALFVDDAFDVEATCKIFEGIHEQLEEDGIVSCNLTGGTKVMALAAYKMCTLYGWEVLYTDSKKLINFDSLQKDDLVCDITNKTIFRLQGQRLRRYDVLETRNEARYEAALKVREFIENYKSCYKALQNYKKSLAKGNDFPPYLPLDNVKGEYRFDGKKMTITKNGEEVLCLERADAYMLLMEGRWWETIVADVLYRWSNGRYEIWQNVEFEPVGTNAPNAAEDIKNEVDILVRVDTTFVFVECKSGDVTQDNLYKLDAVRRTYGSNKSEAILISYAPFNMRQHLPEKAREKSIITRYYNKKDSTFDEFCNELGWWMHEITKGQNLH